jgi:hypothetical protein
VLSFTCKFLPVLHVHNSNPLFIVFISRFEKSCKDELVKEGLLDATSARKIVVAALDDWPDKSKYIEFKEGKMIVNTVAKSFGSSASSCYGGFDVAKVL